MQMNPAQLAGKARKAMQFAHAPYSNFRVGAALLSKEGKVYTGCNVENSSYGLTICAERNAIFKAYSAGVHDFKAIAVVSDDPGFTPPCGACRQVLIDLAGDIDFIMVNSKNQLKIMTLKRLLPYAFTTKNLTRTKRSRK